MIEQAVEEFDGIRLSSTTHSALAVAPVCCYFEDSSTRLSQSNTKDCTKSPSSMGRI
jgi:hypothetical protein